MNLICVHCVIVCADLSFSRSRILLYIRSIYSVLFLHVLDPVFLVQAACIVNSIANRLQPIHLVLVNVNACDTHS